MRFADYTVLASEHIVMYFSKRQFKMVFIKIIITYMCTVKLLNDNQLIQNNLNGKLVRFHICVACVFMKVRPNPV